MNIRITALCILALASLALIHCGVKGHPQVPDYPPFIGRGLLEPQETPIPSPTLIPIAPESTATPTPVVTPTSFPKPKAKKK